MLFQFKYYELFSMENTACNITVKEAKEIVAPYAKFFRDATCEQRDKIMLALGNSDEVIELCKNIKFEGANVLLKKLESIRSPIYNEEGQLLDTKISLGKQLLSAQR